MLTDEGFGLDGGIQEAKKRVVLGLSGKSKKGVWARMEAVIWIGLGFGGNGFVCFL